MQYDRKPFTQSAFSWSPQRRDGQTDEPGADVGCSRIRERRLTPAGAARLAHVMREALEPGAYELRRERFLFTLFGLLAAELVLMSRSQSCGDFSGSRSPYSLSYRSSQRQWL
jgi:hypothetical protein